MNICFLISIVFVMNIFVFCSHSNIIRIDSYKMEKEESTFYENEYPNLVLTQNLKSGYHRKNWKHWIDADKNCLNTRHEVLKEESLISVHIKNCKVIMGKWYDPYTHKYFHNPQKLDIDHFVPLKEAYLSGGSAWSPIQKQIFANDLKNKIALIAVNRSSNRSKGARDPSEWLPPNKSFHCEYIRRWKRIKAIYKLGMDKKEKRFVYQKLSECSNEIRN